MQHVVKRTPETGLYCFQQNYLKGLKMGTSNYLTLWHHRLIHANARVLKTINEHSREMPVLRGKLEVCHPCRLGKAHKKTFDYHFDKVDHPGEIVHSDLAGPLPTSTNGCKYFCTFTDQFSRFSHVAGIRKKSDVAELYEEYKALSHVKKFFPRRIERLHSDGGGEYENLKAEEATKSTPHPTT